MPVAGGSSTFPQRMSPAYRICTGGGRMPMAKDKEKKESNGEPDWKKPLSSGKQKLVQTWFEKGSQLVAKGEYDYARSYISRAPALPCENWQKPRFKRASSANSKFGFCWMTVEKCSAAFSYSFNWSRQTPA